MIDLKNNLAGLMLHLAGRGEASDAALFEIRSKSRALSLTDEMEDVVNGRAKCLELPEGAADAARRADATLSLGVCSTTYTSTIAIPPALMKLALELGCELTVSVYPTSNEEDQLPRR